MEDGCAYYTNCLPHNFQEYLKSRMISLGDNEMLTDFTTQYVKTEDVTFPSDNLRPIYAICKESDAFTELFDLLPPIHLVIDTNTVVQELLFLTKSRKNPLARTSLQEVWDAGVVVIIAPNKIHEEINRHIPRLALENKVSEKRLHTAWQQIQIQISFFEDEINTNRPSNVADPDDLPFVDLYQASGADAVLTKDKDIAIMGARVVELDAMRHVRDYARCKSPEVTLRVGGVAIIGLTVGSVIACAKLISAAVRGFSKLPRGVQAVLVAGAILVALHPNSRNVVSAFVSSLAVNLKSPAEGLLVGFGLLAEKMQESQLELKAKQEAVECIIPRRSKRMSRTSKKFWHGEK